MKNISYGLVFFTIFLNLIVVRSSGADPVLFSVTPDSAMQGQELWVTISGAETYFEQGSASMISAELDNSSYNIAASGINVITQDTLQAFFGIPADAPPDFYDLTVSNTFFPYTITLTDGFRIYADTTPALVSIYPDWFYQGGNVRVTISGVNTHFGQSSSTITSWFTQGSQTFYALMSNAISLETLYVFLDIPDTAPPGLWSFYVDDHIDPILYLLDCFTIRLPVHPEIISVDPDSAWRGDNLDVTITGSNTDFGQGTTTLVWFEQGSITIQSHFVDVFASDTLSASFNIPPQVPFGFYDVWVQNTLNSSIVSALQAFLILYRCGDTNADNGINVSDAVWIINYVFISGSPPPYPLESAEVNCDGYINISDAVWLISYVFLGGSAPCECP